jgi:voltage-gated potassium channel
VTGRKELRWRVYEILERPSRADRLSWGIELALIALIIANVVGVALETVPTIQARYRNAFLLFDTGSVAIFTIEYVLRIWANAEREPELPAWRARLRYARSPMALVDLAAIVPFYLALFLPVNVQSLRMLRFLRVYKLTRYSPALTVLMDVIQEEAATLLAAFSLLAILLVFAATGAYLVEHRAQPDEFGSVPAAMWWAMVTLTTVGYGDVTPVTAAGRVFGAFITVLGVGMAALPAGILASGLADHLHRRRDHLRDRFRLALEDGRIDLNEGRKIERLRRELAISRDIAHAIYDEVRLRRQRTLSCTCPKCGHEFELAAQGNGGKT